MAGKPRKDKAREFRSLEEFRRAYYPKSVICEEAREGDPFKFGILLAEEAVEEVESGAERRY